MSLLYKDIFFEMILQHSKFVTHISIEVGCFSSGATKVFNYDWFVAISMILVISVH